MPCDYEVTKTKDYLLVVVSGEMDDCREAFDLAEFVTLKTKAEV